LGADVIRFAYFFRKVPEADIDTLPNRSKARSYEIGNGRTDEVLE
jgi:hypothetical protein